MVCLTMSWIAALAIVVGLVATATVLGLIWRANTGRVRAVRASEDHRAVIAAEDLGTSAEFGPGATLLQFSTEFCAPCRSTAAMLGELAEKLPRVRHIDIDLTNQPDLAGRYNILQTPTTFILDGSGTVRARIGGAPRREELRDRLDEILGSANVRLS
jgi:thiol-disulfide isomerase/thioredoxin